MSDWLERLRRARQEGRVAGAVRSRVTRTLLGLRYTLLDAASSRVTLHWPAVVQPSTDRTEREFVERLFLAFRRMKTDEQRASHLYRPLAVWQRQLDVSYAPLAEAAATGRVETFHSFLANFGSWPRYLGVESPVMLENRRSILGRSYLRNVIFLRQLALWNWFYSGGRPVTALSYPAHGNQAGAWIDGTFVGPGSFFAEIYGSLLGELLDRDRRPVVAELGAGFGKLAYFTLRDLPRFCYVDFDLPETLCLAAYYLSRIWPDRRVLLYGEAPYSIDAHSDHDLIFMPAFEIERLADESIDLFVNVNSLGEMSREAAANYVDHIARASRLFFHMNHETAPERDPEGRAGLRARDYPVPHRTFRRLFRYPDLGHLLYNGGVDTRSDIFLYLYERRSSGAPAGEDQRAWQRNCVGT